MPQYEEIVGTFHKVRWRTPHDPFLFVIALLEDGTVICGDAEADELVPGIQYKFYGKKKRHATHGESFGFEQFVQLKPHGREAVIAYLKKYGGISPTTASKLWDAYEQDAVKVLRTRPAVACRKLNSRWFDDAKATAASNSLRAAAEFEDTKIELCTLLAGRGFPQKCIDECVQKWAILAPARIRRDPFCLLVAGLPGAGFNRCDQLYKDLGHPLDRLKRQVICLWYALKSDMSGHTWLSMESLKVMLGEHIDGTKARCEDALAVGLRARWLAKHVDRSGNVWIAEDGRAEQERKLAERLRDLRCRYYREHVNAMA